MQKIELLHFSSVEVDHPNRSIKISLTQQSCKNLKFSPSSLLARVEHKINIVLFNLSARTDSVTRWGGGGGKEDGGRRKGNKGDCFHLLCLLHKNP